MKQFKFEYSGSVKLAADLSRVSDFATSKNIQNIWIQVYVMDEDGDCFLPIRDTISLCLPHAKYVVTHGGKAFSADEITNDGALIICNLFEDPTTRLEVKQYPFDPEHSKASIAEIIEYVNANPWIKLISFNAGNDLGETRHLHRMTEAIDPNILMTGGAAITYGLGVEAMLFSSDGNLSSTAIVMTYIGGENFHARTDVIVGWKPIGKEFTITKKSGPVVNEIDGEPAFEIYKKYLKLEPTPGLIVAQTIEFPLCFEDDGMLFLRCPSVLNEDGGIIMMYNDLHVGKKIRLSFGSPDVILKRINEKLRDIATFEPQVISVNSCLGRSFFWGENLKNELGGFRKLCASSGYLTGGELIRSGDQIRIFNETMVTTSMREGDKTPDGSGVRMVEQGGRDFSLTQRLATFIDTVTSDLEENIKEVHRLATTDTLTGLYNRRELDNKIESIAKNKNYSLLMLDADYFKLVNDGFGHQEGDRVLCLLADSIRAAAEESGLEIYAGRWGGDEFLIACVSDDPADAVRYAELLQKIYHDPNAYPNFARTISVGIIAAKPGDDLNEIFQAVDANLYKAKENGKGRIYHS